MQAVFQPDRVRGAGRGLAAASAAALGVAAVPAEVLAQGCAMCQTALGGPDDPLAKGLNVSILFLMSMPFVLVGSVGAWVLYMHRRARRPRPGLRVLRAGKEGVS